MVLNSLSGDFIEASLAALKPEGLFCEIGKRGIWSASEVAQVRPDVKYHTIAIDTLIAEQPMQFQSLFEQAMRFGASELPITEFPIQQVVEALQYMREGQHIGKVVVTQPLLVCGEARYLVTGGLGHIGRLVVRALFAQGAQKVVVLSSTRCELPEDWESDLRPTVVRCDVADRHQVEEVFRTFPDIKGIVHAAGVLADQTLPNLQPAAFEQVYRPKMKGAQNLHESTQHLHIDFFVLFSSTASGFGAAGQANYAAANGFLDALAMKRRREGHPAVSIRWGAWAGGGMATESTFWRGLQNGLLPLSPEAGTGYLLRLMWYALSAVVTVCPLDPTCLPPLPYFSALRAFSHRHGGMDGPTPSWIHGLQSLDEEGRRRSVRLTVRGVLDAVGVGEVEDNMQWGEAGLGMVEVRNGLNRALGDEVRLSTTVLLDYPTSSALVDHIVGIVFPREEASGHTMHRPAKADAVVITGITCRFPGRCNSSEQWCRFLTHCGDAAAEITISRMDWRKWYDSEGTAVGNSYTNRGAFIEDVVMFDHKRLRISAAEAECMDPQQRIALEIVYGALVECNIPVEDRSRGLPIGTFVAAASADFLRFRNEGHTASPYSATGAAASIIANRLAYVFGFRGPSLIMHTACSSSLVAVDAACKALYANDCEQAVVLGINLLLSMDTYLTFCAAGMLSRKGRCATFSNEADGYWRGEGCAAAVLQPLSSALTCGHGMFGMIQGTAVNQDGRTATLTAPHGPSQEAVVKIAIDRAGLLPKDIGYVEAHGTGTPLGDPQEVAALGNVFRCHEGQLMVGAAKTNVGHLELAAGMVGLFKAVLCVQYKKVPGNIHCPSLNPKVMQSLEDCNIVFPKSSSALTVGYAGVSSFGFGGTNGHVVVGAAPEGSVPPAALAIAWPRQAFLWHPVPHPLLGSFEKEEQRIVWTAQWDGQIVEYLSHHRPDALTDLQYAGQAKRYCLIHSKLLSMFQGLGVDEMLDTVTFQDAGLDSMSMTDLRAQVSRMLGPTTGFPPTVLLEHPTLSALVAHIHHTLFPDLESHSTVQHSFSSVDPGFPAGHVSVRHAQECDLPAIYSVEQVAWHESAAASLETLTLRFQAYPEGMLVAEYDGNIVGFTFFQLMHYDPGNPFSKWDEATDCGRIVGSHDASADTVFGVSMAAIPNGTPGIAEALLAYMHTWLHRHSNLKRVIWGARLPDYHRFASKFTIEEYIQQTTEIGEHIDRQVRFYTRNGFQVGRILPGYFKDPASLDYGVIFYYDNPMYVVSG